MKTQPVTAGAIATAIWMSACATDAAAPDADRRPNIVFMLADDWGWGDVGAYGANGNFALTGTNTRTPTLDALARNGTLFTDFHTAQSFCAPSRTGFMTGRYPADLGVNTNWGTNAKSADANHAAGLPYYLPTPAGDGAAPYPGGLVNTPYLLQKSGYATAHFGKWHLGGCTPNTTEPPPYPSEYGFDRTGTYGSQVEAGCLPQTAKDQFASLSGAKDQWWSADVDDYTKEQGIKFMTESVRDGKPFYLQLWWHMSHDTIDPRPEQYNESFPFETTCLFPATASCNANNGGKAGCQPCNWQIFWGSQTWSDMYRFKPVVDAVDALGIRENTYIVFSSDNGAQAERWTNNQGGSGPNRDTSGAFSNAVGTQGPFRGCKASLYDGGHRVPFIVNGPGIPKGRVDHSLISAVDWLPTITSLAGVTVPAGTLLRGEDISSILHGDENDKTMREKPLLWRGGGGPAPCWNRSPSLAARNGDLKVLTDATGTRFETYNMSINGLGRNGAFFEANDAGLTRSTPNVKSLLDELMEWHSKETPCPFGSPPGNCGMHAKYMAGCEAYPFPGKK